MKEIFEEEEIKGEFKNVPIERTKTEEVEIFNVYTTPSNSGSKLRKKIFKYISIIILFGVFIIFTKRILLDGILQALNINYDDIDDDDFNDDNNPNLDNENSKYSEGEIFYLSQNLSNINMKSLFSDQLKNPQNIKLIDNLEITLDVEYDKFVHLKIKDAEKQRWEIPKKEILNKKYLHYLNDNRVTLSIYSNYIESKNFFVEFFTNKLKEEDLELHHEMHSNNNDDYENIEEFSFRLMNDKEEQFCSFNSSTNFIFSDNYINFQYKLTSDNIYGFGERTHEFKLNEGLYTIWPQDPLGTKYDNGVGGKQSYGHHPIGIHKTIYENLWLGFVFLNSNAQDVKITKKNNSEINLEHKTIGGIIDYYIVVDVSPEEVLKDLRFLLGIPTLPPFWSLGFHQSRYGYKNLEEFKNVYEQYKKYEIPIDTMWVDIDVMDKFEIFTINDKFKQLGTFVENEIHNDGGKFVPIVDFGLSIENKNSSLFKLGKSLDIFIKSNYTKKPLISKVWPGKTVFLNFMNPKISEFWNQGLTNLYQLVNFDGIWLDMNEPTTLLKDQTELLDIKNTTKDKNIYSIDNLSYLPGYNPNQSEYYLSKYSISENALLNKDNITIFNAKPFLSYYEGKITYEYLNNNLKKRPFILSRSTTISSGKYVFHWLGDNHSFESDIKESISGIFNFNIFGIPFTGADICGFNNDANKDLCLRWYGLGVFYPFMRNHNDKNAKDQFLWSFNNTKNISNNSNYDTIKAIRDDINCRYSLLRYMYSQLFLISLNEKGSFFKPVMFEFPEEQNSYEDIESKIMLGDAFLICAFYKVNEDDKEFILPKTGFNRYPNGKSIIKQKDENRKITLSGKYNEVHIFLREGFIIPKQNTFEKYILNTNKLHEENLDLIINVNSSKQSHGIIFFDNDDIDTIKQKKYYRVELNFTENKLCVVTEKNNLVKYAYNDHILGNIELWNANNVFNDINTNKKLNIEIDYNKGKEIIEGKYDEENNKILFNIKEKEKDISIFDIKTILFNLK